MIIQENFTQDGIAFVRTYSDSGMKIARQDGVIFDDATDIASSSNAYTETQTPIEAGTAEEVLNIILGGAE